MNPAEFECCHIFVDNSWQIDRHISSVSKMGEFLNLSLIEFRQFKTMSSSKNSLQLSSVSIFVKPKNTVGLVSL